LKVVAAADAIESGLGRELRVAHQVARRELLVPCSVVDAHADLSTGAPER
jgi:hypothetical protein